MGTAIALLRRISTAIPVLHGMVLRWCSNWASVICARVQPLEFVPFFMPLHHGDLVVGHDPAITGEDIESCRLGERKLASVSLD